MYQNWSQNKNVLLLKVVCAGRIDVIATFEGEIFTICSVDLKPLAIITVNKATKTVPKPC